MAQARQQAVVGLGARGGGVKRNEQTEDLVDLVSISDETIVVSLTFDLVQLSMHDSKEGVYR